MNIRGTFTYILYPCYSTQESKVVKRYVFHAKNTGTDMALAGSNDHAVFFFGALLMTTRKETT